MKFFCNGREWDTDAPVYVLGFISGTRSYAPTIRICKKTSMKQQSIWSCF